MYFQDQIDLLENLHVLAGGRYDWAGSEQSESAAGPAGSAEDRAFSPRVGLVYQPTSWLGLYGSYTESFGAMAQFGRSRTGEAFGPETATQYEAGLKADLLDGSLMATLAFYHLTKQDILTPDLIDRAVFSVQIGAARSTPGPPLRPNGTHSLETEVTLYETHHQDPERHVPVDGHEQAPALSTLPGIAGQARRFSTRGHAQGFVYLMALMTMGALSSASFAVSLGGPLVQGQSCPSPLGIATLPPRLLGTYLP